MDKVYDHKIPENKIYKTWEKSGYFTPQIDKSKKPFTIILPLPNASDPMHMGHALFTIEDILIRWHRMMGDPTLWLPGGDHAGIETQYVFEKHLAKEGKSRFDFDRNTLYQKISEFVEKNKDVNRDQMRRLGFSLDWTRYHYSLEPEIVEKVLETFRKLHLDDLIYRGERIVNYCTKCGTAFSDLEIDHVDEEGSLYYLDYGSIQIATARPETIFADVAVGVNPKDKRYKNLVGNEALIPLVNRKIPVIADDLVKKDFGTGALKITPAHDLVDYEIGLKHRLPVIKSIDLNGRMINVLEKYAGMKVLKAREAVLEDLKNAGCLVKIEPLNHTISSCYRCKTTIEPMLMPQWYVRTKPLAGPAIKAVKEGKTKIVPKKRFEKMYFRWMENITDWNISRQIVWGPRIPAWYCLDCSPDIDVAFLYENGSRVSGKYRNLRNKYTFAEIKNGLQSLTAPVESDYSLSDKTDQKGSDASIQCKKCGGRNILQETDTFDTWFLSGQWPITTLGYPDSEDFKYFYPTSVLDTLWDILFFWVARMMMFGIYLTGKVPFEIAHMHARVVDAKGQKMSKSKGNVVNPIEMVDKYGADAVRMTLIFGVSPGSDVSVSEDKIRAMRNFANKVWNIGRYITGSFDRAGYKNFEDIPLYSPDLDGLAKEDKLIIRDLEKLIKSITKNLEKFRFDFASEEIYQFIWHRFADEYLEYSKERIGKGDKTISGVLLYVYLNCLKLLHPFMPFVTEEIWSQLPRVKKDPLIISKWPR